MGLTGLNSKCMTVKRAPTLMTSPTSKKSKTRVNFKIKRKETIVFNKKQTRVFDDIIR